MQPTLRQAARLVICGGVLNGPAAGDAVQQQALQPLAAVVARGVSQQFASSSASNAADHQSTQLLQDSHATSSSDSSNGSSSQAVSRSQTQRLLGSNVPGQTPHLNLLQLSHHRQQQHLQQQQYQQWRCLTDVAPHSQQADESSATGQQILASQRLQQQMQQQQRPQQQQKQRLGQAPGVRSELETALLQAHNVEALAAVVDKHLSSSSGEGTAASAAAAKEVVIALNKLSKLNKVHRTVLKQQIKALQQRWHSLRPLDEQQQEQLQQLQEQHSRHQEAVQAVLVKLVDWLQQVQDSLHVEQWVQVLGCFGSLGVQQQVPGGPALLLTTLQHVLEGLPNLQAKHLSYVATTLGQLHDAERGSSSHDDTPPPEVMDSTGASAASDSMSSGPAGGGSGQHQLQQQQRRQAQAQEQEQAATADMCRLLAQELCGAAQRVASLMDPTAAANFVGAMGRLGHYDWQTMRRVGAVAMQQSQSFGAPQVAKMLAGFTKLRHYDAELCARLAAEAEKDMGNASGLQVAQIMWALAHQRYEQPGVFEAAAYQIPLKAHELQPRHVANLAWAFAVRRAYSPPLYDALAGRLVQLLEMDRVWQDADNTCSGSGTSASDASSSDSSSSGSSECDGLFLNSNDLVLPHHVSLAAWSFAKQGHKHEPMMLAIADRVAQSAGQMLPQNISNTAWAFGSLGVPHPAMFAALAAEAKRVRLEGYNSQNVTDLALGFANAGHQDPELFELVASATSSTLPELSPHSLSDLITAFAKARDPQATKVLEAAAPAVAACLGRFSVSMLADLLCSYAEVGVKDEELLKGAAQAIPARFKALEQDTDSQAKIIWSMKQLGWQDAELEGVLSSLIPNLTDLLQA